MSHQLTDTEIIAMRLFGWVACDPYLGLESRPYRWYLRCACPLELSCYIGFENDHVAFSRHNGSPWPNLQDWNWIRKMEDALRREGPEVSKEYCRCLRHEVNEVPPGWWQGTDLPWILWTATAAQRVQAAVKVLEAAK